MNLENANPTIFPDAVSGDGYLAVRSAMTTLKRHRVDPRNYQYAIRRDGDEITVVLSGLNGQGASQPVFAVRNGTESDPRVVGIVQPDETLQGPNYSAIRVAEEEFLRHVPTVDLKEYRITVIRDGEPMAVTFTDKDRLSGSRGGSCHRPGFEVELDSRELRVLQSAFDR